MLNYFINSFKRKIARRITKKYSYKIDTFTIDNYGTIQFANWENPLVEEKKLTASNIQFFTHYLQKGDMAIDIGANIGLMSVTMGLVVGKKWLVLAFDPNPFVYEILEKNTSLNTELTTIIPHNVAITKVPGDFFYSSSEASFNNGGISNEEKNTHTENIH